MVDMKEQNNVFEIAKDLTGKYDYQRNYGYQMATAESNRILRKRDEDLNNSRNDLVRHSMELKKYSTFDANMLGNMLALLMSIVEGKNYIFKQTKHEYSDWYNGEYEGLTIKTHKYIQMIIDDEDFEYWRPTTPDFKGIEFLPDAMINKYDIHGCENKNRFTEHFIILTKEDAHKDFADSICFYDYDYAQDKLVSLVDFGKFDYVKELIDSLVQYRFELKLEKFDDDEMIKFLSTYLDKNKDVRFTDTLRNKLLVRNN